MQNSVSTECYAMNNMFTQKLERPAQLNSKICNLVNIESKRWLDLNPDDEEESWAGQGARGE